jgi:hypothetical protein
MNISQFTSEELRSYVYFLLNVVRRADGFWFLGAENTCSYPAAIRINEEVWHRMARIMTREIKERFSIQEKGLEGLVKVLRYFPWAIIMGYQVETKDEKIIVSVPHCLSQEARIRQGLGEYDCKNMHYGAFRNIVEEVDKDIKIECLFAPPEPHPKELFCKWHFTI